MELGMGELLVVFVVFMLLFGANKLPQLGEGLGKAIRNFKSSMRGDEETPAPRTTQTSVAPKELPAATASGTAKAAEERETVPRA